MAWLGPPPQDSPAGEAMCRHQAAVETRRSEGAGPGSRPQRGGSIGGGSAAAVVAEPSPERRKMCSQSVWAMPVVTNMKNKNKNVKNTHFAGISRFPPFHSFSGRFIFGKRQKREKEERGRPILRSNLWFLAENRWGFLFAGGGVKAHVQKVTTFTDRL